MINKQGLWFLTLFSLILVLSIYYITMPSEMVLQDDIKDKEQIKEVDKEIISEESNYLTVLKIEKDTERDKIIKEQEKVLNDSTKDIKEKNKAYEQIKNIDFINGIEETLESKIKTNFKLNSFVKVSNNDISIVVDKEKHDVKLANEIMRLIQKEFKDPVVISVKFTKVDQN